jgi:hypothetical protein
MPTDIHDTMHDPTMQASWLAEDEWAREVVPRLPADLESQAKARGAFQRSRALGSASDLLRAILAYVLHAPSFRGLGVWATLLGLASISDSAWRKGMRRAGEWLLWLLGELLACHQTPAWLAGQPHRRVLLLDATHLKEPGKKGRLWRLHCAYDLLAGRLSQVCLTTRKQGEGFEHFALQPGDVVVADGAYPKREAVAALMDEQIDGVFHLNHSSFPLEDEAGHSLDLPLMLAQAGQALLSRAVFFRVGARRLPLRLVALRLGEETSARKREAQVRKHQREDKAIAHDAFLLTGWLLLVTTLPEAQWSAELICVLYRSRWQIELLFKRLKQLIEVALLRVKTPTMVQAVVRAHLIAWVLLEQEAAHLRTTLVRLAQQAASLPPAPDLEWLLDQPSEHGGCLPEEPVLPQERGRNEGPSADHVPGRHRLTETERLAQVGTLERPVSEWMLTSLVLDRLTAQVHGSWPAERERLCLPLLVRFLCSSPRQRLHRFTWARLRVQPLLRMPVSRPFAKPILSLSSRL